MTPQLFAGVIPDDGGGGASQVDLYIKVRGTIWCEAAIDKPFIFQVQGFGACSNQP
jgi:hypothetical protein